MRTIVRLSESNTETNINTGANQKKLEHEVIYSLDEELPIRSSSWRVLSICTEVPSSVLNVNWGQAIIKIRSEILHQPVDTYLCRRKLKKFVRGYKRGPT